MADILAILRNITDDQSIESTTLLENIENWNSLSVIGFLAKVDKECGVRVNPSSLANCQTIGEIMEYVKSQIEAER